MLHSDTLVSSMIIGELLIMDAALDLGRNHFRNTMVSLLIACVLLFGGGWVFAKIVSAARHSQAVAAATNTTRVKPPTRLELPEDIPLYKSGNVGEGKEYQDVIVYEIIFSLGSIEEVKTFYEEEMPAHGWQTYAEGSDSKQYMKTSGKQKASMAWQYYAGKPKLRLTLAKTSS
jgi:hypothetical protein